MAIAERGWTALPVPWAVEQTDRIPKQRYYEPDFFAMEAELFWPRVWQMACRLEEIPEPGDYAEYEILDQSIIVVRTNDGGVKAYENACRHRAVKLIEGHGTGASGFVCPFHGWCYGLDGNSTYVHEPQLFDERNLDPDDIALTPVRCELWGGCACDALRRATSHCRDTSSSKATRSCCSTASRIAIRACSTSRKPSMSCATRTRTWDSAAPVRTFVSARTSRAARSRSRSGNSSHDCPISR